MEEENLEELHKGCIENEKVVCKAGVLCRSLFRHAWRSVIPADVLQCMGFQGARGLLLPCVSLDLRTFSSFSFLLFKLALTLCSHSQHFVFLEIPEKLDTFKVSKAKQNKTNMYHILMHGYKLLALMFAFKPNNFSVVLCLIYLSK